MKAVHNWGQEDVRMAGQLRTVVTEVRFAFPYLWHIGHPHVRTWTATANGRARDDVNLKHDDNAMWYYERMPPGYWDLALQWGEQCRRAMIQFRVDDKRPVLLDTKLAFMHKSPAFNRWSVNPNSLYDQSSLPLKTPAVPKK